MAPSGSTARQLGHGDTSKKTTGRVVKALQSFEVVDVACGADFMMAITAWKSGVRSTGRAATHARPEVVSSTAIGGSPRIEDGYEPEVS